MSGVCEAKNVVEEEEEEEVERYTNEEHLKSTQVLAKENLNF